MRVAETWTDYAHRAHPIIGTAAHHLLCTCVLLALKQQLISILAVRRDKYRGVFFSALIRNGICQHLQQSTFIFCRLFAALTEIVAISEHRFRQ